MIRSPLFVIPPGTRAVIAHLNSPICFRLYMLYVINSSPYDLLLQSLISSSISMPIGLSNWPSSSSVFELFVLRVYDIICPYTKHKSHPLSYIRCLLLSLSLSLFDLSTLIIVVSTLFQINIIVVYCLFSRFSISFLRHPLLSFSLRLLFVFMTRSL